MLRAFYEVATVGSVRKASERMNASPSSISRQIAALEREVGTALFDRGMTGMTLTPAGQIVVEYARGVVIDYDSLRADLNDLRGHRRVTIRIAVIEGMVCEGAIHALRAFRERFDEVSFRIEVKEIDAISAGILSGEFDVGIVSLQPSHEDIRIVTRIADPIELGIAIHHPLAQRASIELAEIATLPLARLVKDPIIDLIAPALADADLVLRPALITNSTEAIRSFVRGGTGAALLSRRTAGRDVMLGVMKTIPVAHHALTTTTIDVITLKGRRLSNIAQRFLEQVSISLGELDP